MEIKLYLQLNILCIFILLIIFLYQKKFSNKMLDERLFKTIIYLTVLGLVVDSGYEIIKEVTNNRLIVLNEIFCFIYFICIVAIPLVWTLYIDIKIFSNIEKFKKHFIWYTIPFFLFVILCIINFWTGWVFYFNEQGEYTRGILYFLQPVLSFVYLVHTGVFCLVKFILQKKNIKKNENVSFGLFVVLPILGGALQIVYPELPLALEGAVCAELVVFINIQNHQLSLDSLTQVNNRGKLNKYLTLQAQNDSDKNSTFLILMDIDEFKKINDTYGHTVGDDALLSVAEILKNVCQKNREYNDFLARYGGDEFALVCKRRNDKQVLKLIEQILFEIEKENESKKHVYVLSLTAGFSLLDKKDNNCIEKAIVKADKMLYKEKIHKERMKNLFY